MTVGIEPIALPRYALPYGRDRDARVSDLGNVSETASVTALRAYLEFGSPDIDGIEARIAQRRVDAYDRVLDAESLPRWLQCRALNVLLRGHLLTPGGVAELRRLRNAVSDGRGALRSDARCGRSLLGVHAGLSVLLSDCESYQRTHADREGTQNPLSVLAGQPEVIRKRPRPGDVR